MEKQKIFKIIIWLIMIAIIITIVYYIIDFLTGNVISGYTLLNEAKFTGKGKVLEKYNGWTLYICTQEGIQKYTYDDKTYTTLYVYAGQWMILQDSNPYQTFRNFLEEAIARKELKRLGDG